MTLADIKNDARENWGGQQEFLADPWTPQPISDVLMAFPAEVGNLLPDPLAIPDEFWGSGNAWVEFANRWFNGGLPGDTRAFMREGIDGNAAFRHLKAILGSYQPKHEHKLAGIGFLASKWFHGVEAGGKVYGHIPEGYEEQASQEEGQ